jgi:predicted house-cleaning noncanonical NTP pyrophosphatase (MazG superfamily)
MEKLVRDRDPDLMRAQGLDPHCRIAEDDEIRVLLHHALTRSASGVIRARGKQEVADALAELAEIVRATADLYGVKPGQLEQIRADKKAERGGYSGRIVWMENR